MDRVVWITGAAGGLGSRLVSEFAAQNWKVVASYRSATDQIATESIWPMQVDVTIQSRVTEALDEILQRWNRVDILINNAGVSIDQLSWQINNDDWDKVVDTNLKGVFLCSKAVARSMIKQGGGQIINITSFAARNGHRGLASYVAAKAGVIGLTQSLAKELGSRNIRINAVMPGVLKTPMTAHLSDEMLAEFACLNALGRLNSVDEVARFVSFLSTLENVSGQVFQMDSRIAPWT